MYALLLLFLVPISLLATPPSNKNLKNIVEDSIRFWNIPGCSVAVIKDGKTVLCKGFGLKKANEPSLGQIDSKTLFAIASLSKTFTATAAAIAVENKDIHFDDPIFSAYPQFILVSPYATKVISYRDALSMRAGLFASIATQDEWMIKCDSQDNLLKKLFSLQLPFGFRGAFYYQNMLYLLVGKALEQIKKSNYEQIIQSNLLTPLSMSSTTSEYSTFIKSNNRAIPHQWVNKKFKAVADSDMSLISPALGIYSNAEDMAKWLQFITKPHKMLSNEVAAELFTAQTVATTKGFLQEHDQDLNALYFPNSHFLSYSMGWFIHDYKGIVIYQAPGFVTGMTPVMAYIPSLELSIAVLCNCESPYFSHAVLFQIIDAYKGWKSKWNDKFLTIAKGVNR
ncbi:MAG: beta-lactamase family protein [Parachlamydiales bacterium]|nr:beta-lactamase family protein [Parachlamydiales bacterium]